MECAHRFAKVYTVSGACTLALEIGNYSGGQCHGCPQNSSIHSSVSEMNIGKTSSFLSYFNM
jgi:hypothetical protein